jgi:UDP-N-acetylmuramate dehydrogenase
MKPQIETVFKSNIPLARHTTLRVGGPVRFFCQAKRAWEVEKAVETAEAHGIKWRVIGEGSNILASDDPIDEAVIAFRDDKPPALDASGRVVVSGGSPLLELVFFCASRGLAGLEKLAGIPGTVGGAIAGNAGAYGNSISEGLESVRILCRDGSVATFTSESLGFNYRSSRLKASGEVVLEATFRLPSESRDELVKAIEESLFDRRAKHPNYKTTPTAGSFFKNLPPPPGEDRRMAAGKLLDEVGAKEIRKGDAGVWHQHANIVVNHGQASARDIKDLADEMSQRVQERFGVTLDPEVTFI